MTFDEAKVLSDAQAEIRMFNSWHDLSLRPEHIADDVEFRFPRIQLEAHRIDSAHRLISLYKSRGLGLFKPLPLENGRFVLPIILVRDGINLAVIEGAHRLYAATQSNIRIKYAWLLDVAGIYPPFPYTLNRAEEIVIETAERPRKLRYNWIEGRAFLDISTPIDLFTQNNTRR